MNTLPTIISRTSSSAAGRVTSVRVSERSTGFKPTLRDASTHRLQTHSNNLPAREARRHLVKLGVPSQAAQGETRVAVVPDVVRRLAGAGVDVVVESGAGAKAHVPDEAYSEAGATVGSADDAWGAEVVAIVRAPSSEEIGRLSQGSVLIGFL